MSLNQRMPNAQTLLSTAATVAATTMLVNWRLVCTHVESSNHRNQNTRDFNATLRSEVRSYELSFHKKHKDKVFSSYLPYVLERAKSITEESKIVKLHTLIEYRSCWDMDGVNLNHPMSFKTLAMDLELKKEVMEDLNNFLNGKEYYKRIGKAWKRGYLLYGPPGTGKSSLIAAMANYLNFDIYDLDLSEVRSNTDLRLLLLGMPSRSILVIEDIDCSIKLENREAENDQGNSSTNKVTGLRGGRKRIWASRWASPISLSPDCVTGLRGGLELGRAPAPRTGVAHMIDDLRWVLRWIAVGCGGIVMMTLSGLLNFIDGLWSCCGDERFIIFTTNYKEQLDPALLRPGRMDVHICMSYCTPSAFKQIALNHLGLCHHDLFQQIERIINNLIVG
uniref:AAA+ ATPase domain-containing protein n=1 Tax=Fagus sylvatica TaxID=28930 RepID=A0A2N9HIS8_FAGSY